MIDVAAARRDVSARIKMLAEAEAEFEPDEAVMGGEPVSNDSLVEFFDHVLTERMKSHPSIEAIRLAFRDISASYDRNAETFRASHQVILDSEMLQAFARHRTSRIDDLIALAIDGPSAFAERDGPPTVGARIAASVVMGMVRPVTDAWLTGDLDRPLVDIADTLWPVLQSILHDCDQVVGHIQKS